MPTSRILPGHGRPPGLAAAVVAQRQGLLGALLPSLLMPVEGTQAKLLAGTRSHEQAVGLETIWTPLLGVLRELVDGTGQDVIVDAGRLGLDGCPMPLIVGADVTVLVVGSSLPAVAAARSWAVSLQERATCPLRVLVVGEGQPYAAREVAGALGLQLLGVIPFQPAHAAVFAQGADYPPARGLARLGGAGRARERFERSTLVRGVTAVGESLRAAALARLGSLDAAASGGERG